MVNRTIQVKVFKMKRRGKHRTWSKAAVKQSVNKERMQVYYHGPHTYTYAPPEVMYGIKDAYHPRIAAQIKRRELLTGVEPEMNVTLVDDKFQLVRMFFNSSLTCFIFWNHNRVHNYVQESISYSNKRRADEVWANQSITWKKPIQFE